MCKFDRKFRWLDDKHKNKKVKPWKEGKQTRVAKTEGWEKKEKR